MTLNLNIDTQKVMKALVAKGFQEIQAQGIIDVIKSVDISDGISEIEFEKSKAKIKI